MLSFFLLIFTDQQSIARTLDHFANQPGSTALRKAKAVNEYLAASRDDLLSEDKWNTFDPGALMEAGLLIFRHALLDRLAFAAADGQVNPFQLVPRSEMPKVPKKFREVCFTLLSSLLFLIFLIVPFHDKRLDKANRQSTWILRPPINAKCHGFGSIL